MWELITSRTPFWDQNNDEELIIRICKNFHPPIINDTPKGYTELMQKCWDSDPNKRPTIFYIFNKLSNIAEDEEESPTKIIKSLDIEPILTNDLDKSQPLNKIINSAGSSKNQFITSTLGK